VTLRQATAVAREARAVLIEGPPGIGKTSLALSLIDRGWRLVGDDGVALSVQDDALIASPAPPTRGLLEVRGIGIVTLPATSARVALVLTATNDPPRYVEAAQTAFIEGIAIPALPFDMSVPAAPLRAEYALALHGLDFSGGSPQK